MAIVRWEPPRRGLGRVAQLASRALRKSPRQMLGRLALALPDEPTDVVLDVSARCNLRCVMCSLSAYGPGRDMPLDVARALGPSLPRFRHVSLACSGEPLLNPHILEMIAFVKRHSRASIGMFTNGTLLTPGLSIELVRLGLDRLVVSLDAALPETYAAIRGDHFDLVMENIRSLMRAKLALGSDRPELSIGFVAMRMNIAELPAVVSLAAELGARDVRVHGLEPYGEEMAHQVLYGPGDCPDTFHPRRRIGAGDSRRSFDEAIREARRLGVGMLLPGLEITDRRYCRPFPHVACDGTLRPCGELVYARPFYWLGEKREHGHVSFGNVMEESFLSLWRSPEYRRFRRSVRRGVFPSVCDDCLMSYGVIC